MPTSGLHTADFPITVRPYAVKRLPKGIAQLSCLLRDWGGRGAPRSPKWLQEVGMGQNAKDFLLGDLLVAGALLAVLFFHAPVYEEGVVCNQRSSQNCVR